jgi:putative toxin-antitoxin system antitoxin component (TIGR02293 family)
MAGPSDCDPATENDAYLRLFDITKSKPGMATEIAAKKGLSISEFKSFLRNTGLAQEDVVEMIGVSMRTFERRMEKGRLTPEEADRLLNIAKIFEMLRETFSDQRFILRWWNTPEEDLNDRSPMDAAKTETGRDQIRVMIGRIRSGTY